MNVRPLKCQRVRLKYLSTLDVFGVFILFFCNTQMSSPPFHVFCIACRWLFIIRISFEMYRACNSNLCFWRSQCSRSALGPAERVNCETLNISCVEFRINKLNCDRLHQKVNARLDAFDSRLISLHKCITAALYNNLILNNDMKINAAEVVYFDLISGSVVIWVSDYFRMSRAWFVAIRSP